MFIGDETYFTERILESNPVTLQMVLSDIDRCYHTFQIPKTGGARTIQAIKPDSALYRVQKSLCQNFLDKIPLPTPAVGFVKGESYLSFLSPHVGKRYYMRLDIHDFFGSITQKMLKNTFQEFFPENNPDLLQQFARLCLYRGVLPQGAVTSPCVSNVVFRRIDQRILKYCQSFDVRYLDGWRFSESVRYTRYADDLLFSSNYMDFSRDSFFSGMISHILKDCGFSMNPGKTKYGDGQISLSGYVLGNNIHLSRQKLYSLNKLLYFFGKTDRYTDKKYRVRKALFQEQGWLNQVNQLALPDGHGVKKQFKTVQELVDTLCGFRAFLIAVLRTEGAGDNSAQQLAKKIKKLEAIIDCILSQA